MRDTQSLESGRMLKNPGASKALNMWFPDQALPTVRGLTIIGNILVREPAPPPPPAKSRICTCQCRIVILKCS